MKDRRWLVLVAAVIAALQIGFLVSMIAGRASLLRTGNEVVLAVEPVDPRDLLRGDYVTLTYNISRISPDLFSKQQGQEEGQERDLDGWSGRDVYVRLQADEDGIFQPVAASFDHQLDEAPAEGQVDIRGQMRGRGWGRLVTVRYGVERFYVPEGEGKAIEQDLRTRTFRMKLSVAEDGTAQIKSFHDGEKMLYAEPIY